MRRSIEHKRQVDRLLKKLNETEAQVVESQKAYNHQAHCAHLLSNELAAAREEIERVKQERLGYQDTVYAVCQWLDRKLGLHPSKGQATQSSKDFVISALDRAFGIVYANHKPVAPTEQR